EDALLSARAHVPQSHFTGLALAAWLQTGHGQGLAVGAVRHGGDPAGVALEDGLVLPRSHVPQPYRLVLTGRGQGLAVRAEGHRSDSARVILEDSAFAAPAHVPQFHVTATEADSVLAAATRSQPFAVGAEG